MMMDAIGDGIAGKPVRPGIGTSRQANSSLEREPRTMNVDLGRK